MAIRKTSIGTKKNCTFFMTPTLFFTLNAYAFLEATVRNYPTFQGEGRSKDERSTYI